MVSNLTWKGPKSGPLLTSDVYASVPAVTNLLHNSDKVEVLEFTPRTGLRAFEKKSAGGTMDQGWFWVKKRENRHPKQGREREIDDKERK